MSPKQSVAELEIHLREQILFLASSCQLYDAGTRAEYKRMTAPLRIILHNTSKQKSLLKLLHKNEIPLFDTARDIDPTNMLPHIGLSIVKVVRGGPSSYEAPLDMTRSGLNTEKTADFDDWWNKTVLSFSNYRISRKDLVLTVAEKDGGVHVDPKLGTSYYKLSRLNALGWISTNCGIEFFVPIDIDNPPPLPEGYTSFGGVIGPVSASVRQIAHEVIRSLLIQYPKLLAGVY